MNAPRASRAQLLTTAQVAHWANVTEQTVLAWKKRGYLETVVLDKGFRFKESEIEEFLEKRTVGGGQPYCPHCHRRASHVR